MSKSLDILDCQGAKVGEYAITPSGLTASNYEITFLPGTLNVAKADVSVKAPVAKEKLVYSG